MTFVATRDNSQVFVIQNTTIEKYKEKWLAAVDKYYNEILPAQEAAKVKEYDDGMTTTERRAHRIKKASGKGNTIKV